MMMKFQFWAALPLIVSLQGVVFPETIRPVLAQTVSECDRQQEIFGFQISNYAVAHQGGAILNLKVAWRMTPEAIAKNAYPDFIPIKKEIDTYLTSYPNNNDYWEIVNKKLVQRLFDKYPQMSSLNIELEVMPTSTAPYPRYSIVRSTRPQGCPIQ